MLTICIQLLIGKSNDIKSKLAFEIVRKLAIGKKIRIYLLIESLVVILIKKVELFIFVGNRV